MHLLPHEDPTVLRHTRIDVHPARHMVCVKLSHHTWWYAHGMDLLGFPSWLMPMHGLLAHWVLDAYWLVTLTDVRKATLP